MSTLLESSDHKTSKQWLIASYLVFNKTEFGSVRVKVKKIGNEIINASPEYEDCKEIAEINGLSLQEVFLIVQRQFSEK